MRDAEYAETLRDQRRPYGKYLWYCQDHSAGTDGKQVFPAQKRNEGQRHSDQESSESREEEAEEWSLIHFGLEVWSVW